MKKILTLLVFSFFLTARVAFALNVGEPAPGFELPSAGGKVLKSTDFAGKIIVLEWMNPGCPYVKKHYREGHMQKLQAELTKKEVIWLTINSTNSEHGDFVPEEKRQEFVREQKIASTAYLTDEEGKVGLLYEAKTTPHLFVIDQRGILAYQGAIDDTPMGDPARSRNYVVQAVDELLQGKAVSEPQTRSYGCSVKY